MKPLKLLALLLCIIILSLTLFSCNSAAPSIEINDDGCWVINGVLTDVKAEGIDGKNGADGKDGAPGKDGVGIEKIEIINDRLVITYTDGTIVDVGSLSSDSEGIVGLDYYPLDDGTYAVKVGKALMLSEIAIPSTYAGRTVSTILDNAFDGCVNLTNITIPDSVTNIGASAFYKCSNLTSINIPDGVTSINECAFWSCRSLTSITIPDSVTSIDHHAFTGCSSLTSINFEGSVAEWGAIYKGFDWDYEVPATEVVCSDGVVKLK